MRVVLSSQEAKAKAKRDETDGTGRDEAKYVDLKVDIDYTFESIPSWAIVRAEFAVRCLLRRGFDLLHFSTAA
jgi:hypothetical protein